MINTGNWSMLPVSMDKLIYNIRYKLEISEYYVTVIKIYRSRRSHMKINLLTQIFIAFVLAIILGAIFGPSIDVLKPLGDLFLRLIKFIIVPLVLTSLIVGVASSGDVRKLGVMGGKTVAYYLITTLIAIIIGLGFGLLLSPGTGLNIQSDVTAAEVKEAPGVIQTFLNIIPTNPIQSLVEANILQIIFFAILLGIGITMLGDKGKGLFKFFDDSADVMYKITGIVMKVAPLGVLGLIAPVVGNYGMSILLPLLKLILAVVIAVLLHAAIVYSFAVKLFAKMSPLTFFKGVMPAALVAFSTTSSAATLPVTMQNARNLGVSNRISSFVVPLGATVNMDGTAIYQGVSALFIAQFFGIELSIMQMIMIVITATLASIGTAGVPGAGMIMLAMVLTSVGLPLEGVALIAGIDRILDMFRTSINVVGDLSAAVVVAASEGQLNIGKSDEGELTTI